ncbi:MAG: hypothetical protein LC632_07535, partial [Xanthomonadaceae bacterium]|nr:hypothetical protein [Xanthomonadaceae bacterium]
MLRSTIAAFAALLLSFAVSAEVPTFAEVSGHEIAERISTSNEVEAYLQRLAEASPRVTYQRQGRSWEGRPLMLAVVTSPGNHARIDEIMDIARRLDDSRLRAPTAAEIRRQPVIVWLGGSIHGFELSGTEGLLLLLDHLTTRDDADTRTLLDNTVVLVDPMLNPDGRDAFAHRNHKALGRFVTADRNDWSNDFTSWEALTYRGGHYFFDTNRDWFVHSQRETRERMPTFRSWRPQVAVDLHEMGPDNEFFFDPPTEPSAPYFPAYATEGFELFGRAYAAAFDEAGFDYTTRQFYNYFYPGYTTSWTSYQGAIGMLYEQGSSRGLALERSDGSVRTLLDAATQQYTAALTALRASSSNRAQLLDRYAAGGRDALADGERGTRRYVIAPGGDPLLADELAAALERNGIEVQVTTAPASLRGIRGELPAGTLVVDAAQPRNRLARTLLERHLQLPDAFLAAARARLERNENPRFYDITAYSLPLLFGLDAATSADGRALQTTRWQPREVGAVPEAAYAWLIDGRQAASAAAAALLRRDGIRVRIAPDPFTHGGHDFGSGTVIVRAGDDGTHARLGVLAAEYGLEVRAAAGGLAERGLPALSAGEMFSLRPPEVALVGDHPVHAQSFGWAWHALDAQYGIPTTVLRTRSLGGTPLERFTTLILPALTQEGELTRMLGDDGIGRLKRWVNDGGTLVAIGSGADWVQKTLELAQLRDWYEVNKSGTGDDAVQQMRISVPG